MTLHLTNIDVSSPVGAAPKAAKQGAADRKGFYRAYFKRCLDLCAVIVTAPFTIPVIGILAIFVAMDGGNPFFSQKRVGRDGRAFRIWKLRSMVVDADAQLARYLEATPEARAEWDRTQKLKNDPRITAVGRILRKTSLDELPQLFNVLNGTMSIVGPRPMLVEQKPLYTGSGYYRLRPGITGLWQVSARNEGEFVGRVKFDDLYDRTVSFGTDLRVMFRTVGVMLRATGY